MTEIMVALFCLFFAFLTWRNLAWGIIIISALLPSYLIRFQIGFMPMTLLEAMVLILFLFWGIRFLQERRSQNQTFTLSLFWKVIIFIWIALATIAVFISPERLAALGVWKAYFIEPILFFIVFINVMKTSDLRNKIFVALGLSAIYVSLFAVYQKFTGFAISNLFWQAEETRRVTSFFGYPNAVGLYLAPIAVLYFGWLFEKTRALFLIGKISVIILSVLAIVFAVSEGAMVGVFIGAVLIILFYKQFYRVFIIGLAIALLFISSNVSVRETLWQKITLQDFSGQVRLVIWKETVEMLKTRPIFGAGLAGYQSAVAPFHQAKHIEIYLYPHNIFLNFWSELGIFGLLIFVMIMLAYFTKSLRKLKTVETRERFYFIGLMGAMSAVLVQGLVDVPYFKNDLSVFFWLLVGLLLSKSNINKEPMYGNLN